MGLGIEKLNKEQKEAVTHGKGPLLIVAGAGTGKTTVVTKRLAWLIEKERAKPEEILALTFTDKAAGEMKERVDKELKKSYLDLWVMTFHSFSHRVLQERGLDIGLPTSFDLLDQTDSWLLVRRNLEKFDLHYYKPLGRPTKFIHALVSHFSKCKDQGVTPDDYLKYARGVEDQEEKKRRMEIAEAYRTYQKLLLNKEALDFGDLINYAVRLFEKRKNIRDEYRDKFKYILVDEFQDTNRAQYDLMKILAAPDNNLTVCGDDEQAIYRFRGASFGNIIQFTKDYPEAEKVNLFRNYRSQQNILDFSYRLIQNNNPHRLRYMEGIDKKLEAHEQGEARIEHLHFKTAEGEVQGVAKKIREIREKEEGVSLSDFAVLVRTNNTALAFCREFERMGVPHRFLALRGLYYKPVIMDTTSYFKLVDDYQESQAFYRVLKIPSLAIHPEAISKLTLFANKKSIPLFKAAERAKQAGIGKKERKKIKNLLSLIKKHTELAREKNVSEVFISFLEEVGYLDYLTREKDIRSIRYVNQFYSKIKAFEGANRVASVKNFMRQVRLELEAGEEGKVSFDPFERENKVKILTIHKAKGLEFEYVFLVNLVNRRFPTINRSDPIELPDELIRDIIPKGNTHLEEERRLFYVGMTRAKKGLFFTSALDYGGVRKKKPSRFLKEIKMGEKEPKEAEAVEENVGKGEESKKGEKKKGKEEEAISAWEPKYFSFSQFQAFEKCPLQYKFAHVLKIPIRGKAVFSYGKTMHNTLERFVKEGVSDYGELIDIYEEEWIENWFDSREEREKYFKQGKESLKLFFNQWQERSPTVLEMDGKPALEKNFHLKVKGETVFGKIDRIDQIEGGVELVDYKTGKVKQRLRKKDKQQLLIYQIAAREALGLEPKKLTYLYLNEGKRLSFVGDKSQIEKQKQNMNRLIKNIKKAKFDPTPGWQCRFCDFKNICQYAKK